MHYSFSVFMLVNLCRASDKLPASVPVLAAWMVTRGHIHSHMLREAHTPVYLHFNINAYIAL